MTANTLTLYLLNKQRSFTKQFFYSTNTYYNRSKTIQPWLVRAVIVQTLQIVGDVLSFQTGTLWGNQQGQRSTTLTCHLGGVDRYWWLWWLEAKTGGYYPRGQEGSSAGAPQELGAGHSQGDDNEAKLHTKMRC